MAIPSYQTLMLPLLKFSSHQNEFSNKDAVISMSKEFQLTVEERETLQESRRETVLSNRVRWALFYLKRYKLLEGRRKGFYKITDRGIQVLNQSPVQLDIDFLNQFGDDSVNVVTTEKKITTDKIDTVTNKTPEELFENNYQIIKEEVKSQLLDSVKNCSSTFFEHLVVELLVKMGYGGSIKEAGKAIGKTGDEGIDGIIKEDILGMDVIYIQAKRWDGTVGRPDIHKFAGALQGQRSRKGIFITTGKFSNDALEYTKNIDTKIVLIDGDQLAEYMIDHNIGVTDVKNYVIKNINSDYFEERV
jgi:restriction system protein